jgi:hypothetical protein
MHREVVLVQATTADAEARSEAFARAGFRVRVYNSRDGTVGLLQWLTSVPAAFLIDLDRSPSVGRAKGMWLRQRKDTRQVPLVFAGGQPEAVAQVRGFLPDATFTTWEDAVQAVEDAIASPPANPVVPDPMAPYRGATLSRKLNIRAGMTVALIGAPAKFEDAIDGLPEGVRFERRRRDKAAMALLFIGSLASLDRQLDTASSALADHGALWVIWPKRASGVRSDLTQASVRKLLMERHWVDYKVASVDATWTGMVFARRDNTQWLAARGRRGQAS